MRTYWEEVERHTVDQFEIVTSITPEEMHPSDSFDDSCHDIDEICRKIDCGIYLWFVAKVTVYKNGIALADDYLGGCLYDKIDDFLNRNDYWGDMIHNAISEANTTLIKLAA